MHSVVSASSGNSSSTLIISRYTLTNLLINYVYNT
uniref:Uncharacterized protein n=1 Tax=Siphoviridae sp. ctX5W26 TaxID=2825540 RepID=A0A8S5UEK5_9CAUD|nr:MAG TPA: hypothetical protein [Siphoviridae sp. ctX5W26]